MEEKIKACVFQALESATGTKGEGVYLVCVRVKGAGKQTKIEILLDSDTGIRIDQCSFFSRRIRELLENEGGTPVLDGEDFDLMVSSPGLGESLLMSRQYLRHIGRLLRVIWKDELQSEKIVTGRLRQVLKTEGEITAVRLVPVKTGKKGAGNVQEPIELTLDCIVRAVPEAEL